MGIPVPKVSRRTVRRGPQPQTVRPENESIHGRSAEKIDEAASLSVDLDEQVEVVSELLTIADLLAFAAVTPKQAEATLLPGSFASPATDTSYVAAAQSASKSNGARSDLGGLAANTYELKMTVANLFGIKPGSIGGRAYRPYRSDHTTGHAIDIPGSGDRGQQIADWVITVAAQFKVKYIIFNRRIWYPGKGWQVYNVPKAVDSFASDGAHTRHVHVSTY